MRAARLFIGVAFSLAASWAWSHAGLVDQTPGEGAVLEAAPLDVRLRFSEPVLPLVLSLTSPDGSTQKMAHLDAATQELQVPLPPSGIKGTYWLSWRVVSTDGHPVGGSLTWSVQSRTETPSLLTERSSPLSGTSVLIWLSRLGLYLALFACVGAAMFRAFLAADPTRWRFGSGRLVVLGLISLVVAVGALGLDATSGALETLVSMQPWRVALQTSYGPSAGLVLASLLTSYLSQRSPRRVTRVTALVALALSGAAFAVSGHASSAPPVWIARSAVFLHIVAVTFWIGSLWPLAQGLTASKESGALQSLLRFSRAIPAVLIVIGLSGATLVFLQFDRFDSLWTSGYGRLLGFKLLLVVALLGVAAFNRYALTERVMQGKPEAHRSMRRLVCVEIGLAVAIVAVVATWRFTPPPRSLVGASGLAAMTPARSSSVATAPLQLRLSGTDASADVALKLDARGQLGAQLSVALRQATPGDAQGVSLRLTRSGVDLEPIVRVALRQSDGTWRVEPFALPAGGRWRLSIDLLITDFDQVTLDYNGDVAL